MEEIGLYDTPILFFRNVRSIGTQGEVVNTYELECELFCKVEVGRTDGNEYFNYIQNSTLTVTTYKVPGMTTMWRAKIRDQWYDITDITSDSRISPINTLTLTSVNGEC